MSSLTRHTKGLLFCSDQGRFSTTLSKHM